MAPQTKQILRHLLLVGNISGLEAQNLYKARSLSRRINDLEEMGVVITREHKKDITGQRYVRYHLVFAPLIARRLSGLQNPKVGLKAA